MLFHFFADIVLFKHPLFSR